MQADAGELGDLLALADAMPAVSLELREISLELSEEVLKRIREIPGEAGASLRAAWLNNLSVRLAEIGRREDALAASEETVEIYRTLAAARPDAFRPDLAGALNNLSVRLAELGRREDALAASEETVEIYRTLAEARPDAFADPLSISLWVMADHLDAVGNNTAAIEANRTAIVSLAPLFYRHVAALAPKIGDMVKEYLQRCERAGVAPDEHLLAPIAAHLEALQSEETSTDEGT